MEKVATIIALENNPYNSMYRVLFADALELSDVYSVVEKNYPEGRLFDLLPSRKLRKLTRGLSVIPYFSYYNLSRKVKELCCRYDRIDILFHNSGLRKPRYPLVFFDSIRKYPVTLNLIYLDIHDRDFACSYANMLCENNVFDRVLTFDPDDAKKYNMELCSTPYSKLNVDQVDEEVQLYFCGTNAGRMYQLYLIWLNAKNRSIAIKYDLIGCQDFKLFFENDKDIMFREAFVEYPRLIGEIQKTSCILDVTQPGQAGFTLRPYEAVVYNKKLLTNNKQIFEFQFYDGRYMRYFEQVEDIDWEWLREPIKVDYRYKGEFSPQILLQRLNDND